MGKGIGMGMALVLLAGCSTVDGQSPTFLQGAQQVVGGGLFGACLANGDLNCAQQGKDTLLEGLGAR
ncbi:MAG TPA: hypothetical protein VF211_13400 [Burkholderiales bacterium]